MKNYRLILPADLDNPPDDLELRAASSLATYFKSDIEFVPRSGLQTPDIKVVRFHQLWEMKSPRGNSKNTIHHNLDGGKNQSPNVVITLYRTKMPPSRAVGYIKKELRLPSRLKQAILITKQEKILVFKRRK